MSKSAIPQIAIHAIRPLLDALRARGIDPATLFAEIGLHGLPLGDPEVRLPLVCLDELWDRAAARLGDADLGLHLAESVGPGTFGLLSHLCSSSASLGEGLQRVFRYFRLLSEGSSYELTVCDDVATVIATQDTPTVAPVRQRVEFTVSVLCCYVRQLLAGEWRLLDVFFEHAAPVEVAEHCRLYGQLPRFSAPHSGFSFPRALLN